MENIKKLKEIKITKIFESIFCDLEKYCTTQIKECAYAMLACLEELCNIEDTKIEKYYLEKYMSLSQIRDMSQTFDMGAREK